MAERGPLSHLSRELEALSARGLLRDEPAPSGEPPAAGFCSNDYLGLAALGGEGLGSLGGQGAEAPRGAGASRLLGGDHPAHHALEAACADLVGAEAALVFASGYAANVGALSCLAREGDLVVSDALNHASIIDGCRLSRARVVVAPHGDLGAIDAALAGAGGRAWVVVESYFSMDADGPDLAALRAVCDARGAALVVDEAHALGVFGPEGGGRLAEAGVRADVTIGTLGKAFGAQGAFVAGSATLRSYLWNRARAHVFSTGMSPRLAELARDGVARARASDDARRTLHARAARFREIARAGGLAPLGFGPIVPIVLGAPDRAVRLAARLREDGVRAMAVRPPTVPEGTARLRFTVTARHSEAEVSRAAERLVRLAQD